VFACGVGETAKEGFRFLSERKNEVRVGDRWCCEWTWERSHCKQYWGAPSGLWLSSYFYQDWYFFLVFSFLFGFNCHSFIGM